MSPLNTSVLILYVGAMLAIGWIVSRGVRSTEDYFLAGRRMPWLAVAMSMFASLTSAVTFMGLPGISFAGNLTLLAVAVVSPVLAPILMFVFYPVYKRGGYTTSYEYIEERFGRVPRKTVAVLFLLARLGWMGTVIFAPALALALATGLPQWMCIVLIGLLATVYTALGGIRAVIWTDAAQFVILVGGAVWIMVSLLQASPEGWGGIWHLNREAGQARLSGGWDLTKMTLGIVFISFFFQMMQDYGTDQVTVQRLLSTKSLKGIRQAILFNALTDTVMISLLLAIGLGLYAFVALSPGVIPADLSADQILPYYILHALPDGVSGLVIAGIFAAAMSSVDSGVNSIVTVGVHDILEQDRSPGQGLALARLLTWGVGGLATGVAFYVAQIEGIIKAFTQFMSLFNAPVLALFLLGLTCRKATFAAWLPGAGIAIPCTVWIQHGTDISWVYYFPISFGICFTVSWISGYIFSFAQGGAKS